MASERRGSSQGALRTAAVSAQTLSTAPPTAQSSNRTSLLPDPQRPKEHSKSKRLSNFFYGDKHLEASPAIRTRRPDVGTEPDRNPVIREEAAQQPVVQEQHGQRPLAKKKQNKKLATGKEKDKKRFSILRKPKPQEPSAPSEAAPRSQATQRPAILSELNIRIRVSASPATQSQNRPSASPGVRSQSRVSTTPVVQPTDHVAQSQDELASSGRMLELRAKYPEAVRILKENTFRIGKPDFRQGEALLWAAENGHAAAARFLIIEYSFNDDFSKMAALSGAAKGGHVAVLNLFLNLNFVDVKRKYCYFKTDPLHEVVKYGNEVCVQRILDAGANVQQVCQRGQTSLHEAAAYGNVDAIHLLLKHKASTSDVNSNRESALHLAVKQGHTAAVKILLEDATGKPIIDDQTLDGSTALHLAVQNKHQDVVELLLAKTRSINAVDDEGRTPLDHAIANRHEAIARLLYLRGAQKSPENLRPSPSPPSGRRRGLLEILGADARDFLWNPDTGLEAKKKRTTDKNYDIGFDYEPGYIDYRY